QLTLISLLVANNFPFSSWGEALFLMLQTVTIGFLIQHYGKRTSTGLLFMVIYFILLVLLLSPVTPMSVVTSMQAFNMPAIIIGRVAKTPTCVLQRLPLRTNGQRLFPCYFCCHATCFAVLGFYIFYSYSLKDPRFTF
uniref:Uncharacterized protein n=1 Tax=Pundamilia nyererei TaxID=303518 RepID=A0A3B4FQF5_9CICH